MSATFLVVQHVPHEDLGSWTPLFKYKKVKLNWIRPFKNERIPVDAKGVDGLVVMGGPMGVYEQDRFPFLTRELHLIESALKHKVPTIGVCLGSQLLAEASGGKVFPGHQKEIGWFNVQLTSKGKKDPSFRDFPSTFEVFQWHGDTFRLSKQAIRLVESEEYPNQAFRIGCAIGLQFHIEMTASLIQSWLKEGGGEIEPLGGEMLKKRILNQMPKSLPYLQKRSQQFFQNTLDMIQ